MDKLSCFCKETASRKGVANEMKPIIFEVAIKNDELLNSMHIILLLYAFISLVFSFKFIVKPPLESAL
jgi:hypothetical protein